MTLGAWLRERPSVAPPRLTARIEQALGSALDTDMAEGGGPDVCAATAETLLRDLLARSCTARELALDLLAVDALMTYAFEIAAGDLPRLEVLALDAMRRLDATTHE